MSSQLLAKTFKKAIEDGNVTVGDFGKDAKVAPIHLNKVPYFSLQTPELKAPYGISAPYNPNNPKGNVSYGDDANFSLNLSLGDTSRQSVKNFIEAMEKLKELVIDTAAEKSKIWFGKVYPKEMLSMEEFFQPMIKMPKEDKVGQYPPSFKITVPRKDGKFLVDASDVNGNPIDLNKIDTRNAMMTCIVRCCGIWCVKPKFGIKWKLTNVRIIPQSSNNTTIKFIEDVDRLATPEIIRQSEEILAEEEAEKKTLTEENAVEEEAMMDGAESGTENGEENNHGVPIM